MALKNFDIQRDIDRTEIRKTMVYAFVLVTFFAMVFFYIRQSIVKVRLENQIEELTLSKGNLIQNNQKLRIERRYLSSLPYIERVARERLGLADPQKDQLVILGANALTEGNDG